MVTLARRSTKWLIMFLFEVGKKESLDNWKPITLLNLEYEMLPKALQQRLQITPMEVVDIDQTAFLPSRYVIDNVILAHETIDWARCFH
jgi:hypothetical protein